MFPEDIDELARRVLALARGAGVTLATVESCTGGLVSGALTAIPGSSDVVDRGFVAYSNAAKTALVGVPEALIAEFGAVSAEVARAMAEGGVKTAGVGAAEALLRATSQMAKAANRPGIAQISNRAWAPTPASISLPMTKAPRMVPNRPTPRAQPMPLARLCEGE